MYRLHYRHAALLGLCILPYFGGRADPFWLSLAITACLAIYIKGVVAYLNEPVSISGEEDE